MTRVEANHLLNQYKRGMPLDPQRVELALHMTGDLQQSTSLTQADRINERNQRLEAND